MTPNQTRVGFDCFYGGNIDPMVTDHPPEDEKKIKNVIDLVSVCKTGQIYLMGSCHYNVSVRIIDGRFLCLNVYI